MIITQLKIDNWKNFRSVKVDLQPRAFFIGPNASGKSNLLDAIRFLRDIAEPEGGFQRAIKSRHGIPQLRCLHARQNPNVGVSVAMQLPDANWEYALEFAQDNQRRPIVKSERVTRDGKTLLRRPLPEDKQDPSRLTQTHLEQVNANKEFRDIAEALAQVRYIHIVPQLIRDAERFSPRPNDPFGSDFLEQIVATQKRTLESRLKKINNALQVAVPHLHELSTERDSRGVPHLKGRYEHWRPNAGWQTEEHFSDGTLRMLGLLWAILDGDAPLLLEEPELSLHTAIVRHLPSMMAGVRKKNPRQILLSSHSPELLSDQSIGLDEVLLLQPTPDGTVVKVAADDEQIRALMAGGMSVGDAVIPRSAPTNISQLSLFST